MYLDDTRIVLTAEQLAFAYEMGRRRQENAIANRRKQVGGGSGDVRGYGDHREGCAAEYACAIHWGVPWDPTIGQAGRTKNPNGDLLIFRDSSRPLWIEIRHSPYENAGLIYYEGRDKPDRPYVLVTGKGELGKAAYYNIRGWLTGWDAKRLGHWQEGKGGNTKRWLRTRQRQLNSLGILEDFNFLDDPA